MIAHRVIIINTTVFLGSSALLQNCIMLVTFNPNKTDMLLYSREKKWLRAKPIVLFFPGFTNILGELSHLRGAVKYHTILILGSILNICREHITRHTQMDIYCSCCTELAQGHSSPLSPGT